MSEHHTPHHGHETHHKVHETHEDHVSAEHAERLRQQHEHHAEQLGNHHEHEARQAEMGHEARRDALQEAAPAERHRARHEQPMAPGQPAFASAELQSMQLKRTLTSIQKRLPAPERALSKFMHQPVVDAVSEIGGKTVARPAGILAGGIFAFLGTTVILYICKHYGYTYNFLLFAVLFIGGFALGLLVESIWRLTVRRKSY